jgi:DNA-binding NtrC family response regulator
MIKKVTIINDQDVVKDVLAHFFEAQLVEVETFDTGLQFIENGFSTKKTSIFILDLILPDIGGIEIYDMIRGYESDSEKKPVLLISAKNISSDLSKRMRDDKMLFYFQKPIDPEEIVDFAMRLLK